jgi:hypothetical protein
MISALFVAAAILVQAAATAESAPAAAAPPASATVSLLTVTPEKPISKRREVDPTQMVCHDELPIGSHFPKKVCATNGAFAERARENQELVRDWQKATISTSQQ